ncbi:MAG: hypothetical protein QNK37_23540 [Acidobacteriota bacterium]|nr:hypothetical protein [Acidobacteriota bacterium]
MSEQCELKSFHPTDRKPSDRAVLLQGEHPEAESLERILGDAGYRVARCGHQAVAVLAFRDFQKLMSRVRYHKTTRPDVQIIAGLEDDWNENQVTRALAVYGVRHFYRFPLTSDAVVQQVETVTR